MKNVRLLLIVVGLCCVLSLTAIFVALSVGPHESKPENLQLRTVEGRIWMFNPQTGALYTFGDSNSKPPYEWEFVCKPLRERSQDAP